LEELTKRIVDIATKLKTIEKKQGPIVAIKIQNEPIVVLKHKVHPQTYYYHNQGKYLLTKHQPK
jgi:hypothetical protein